MNLFCFAIACAVLAISCTSSSPPSSASSAVSSGAGGASSVSASSTSTSTSATAGAGGMGGTDGATASSSASGTGGAPIDCAHLNPGFVCIEDDDCPPMTKAELDACGPWSCIWLVQPNPDAGIPGKKGCKLLKP